MAGILLFNDDPQGRLAMFHDFDEEVEVTTLRREYANLVQYWSNLRNETPRDQRDILIFIKEQIKAAQRMEKACNIWLSYYLDVGYRTITNFPEELNYELGIVFGVIYNAKSTQS